MVQVPVPTRLSVLALAVLAAIATTPDSIEATGFVLEPFTPISDVIKLNHYSPMYGGYESDQFPRPVVKERIGRRRLARGPSVPIQTEYSEDLVRLEKTLGSNMTVNFDQLMLKYSSGEASTAPWPNTLWPHSKDSINAKWLPSDPSPTEKYALAMGLHVKTFQETVSRELGIQSLRNEPECRTSEDCGPMRRDGGVCALPQGNPMARGHCVYSWLSLSHATAAASILEPEPQCEVVREGTTFRAMDIKALLAGVYDDANIPAVFIGARSREINIPEHLGQYGRPQDPSTRDLNPGLFHIAVTNLLGRLRRPFVLDLAVDFAVQNFPVRRYRVTADARLSPSQAASQLFNERQYPFNNRAAVIIPVTMELGYVRGTSSESTVDSAMTTEKYKYALELDAEGNVIGGEWLAGSVLKHPDFLWFPTGARPEQGTRTTIGLDYDAVHAMAVESAACGASTPTPSPTPSTNLPPANGPCGNDQTGPEACREGQYCQPWNPAFYQCRSIDAKCGKQETGVDFYGDDLAAMQLVLPEECCAACRNTPGCKAYTFINYNPDGKAYCYLKKGSGQRRAKVGAVSAVIKSAETKNKCSPPQRDVDYYGDDLAQAYGVTSVDACSDKCATTDGCKTYTFIEAASACYLKKGTGERREVPGAQSATCGQREPLSKCVGRQEGIDYYGNDLGAQYGISESQCCDACRHDAKCAAFTFIPRFLGGSSACFLKSGVTEQRKFESAVSVSIAFP